MTEMRSYPPGYFCWVELATGDWKAAKKFYGSLFGWTTEEMPMGDQPPYVMLKSKGKSVGALYENKKAKPAWLSYVAVSSADETAKKAKKLGGTILSEPFDVMTAGRMANLQDPEGSKFAIWQANQHKGAELINEPNAMCWNELYATDLAKEGKFYSGLFGWKLKTTPEYTEIHVGQTAIAGMLRMEPMKGWFPYFCVTDCDAAVKKATASGAKIHVEPKDIPKVGRFSFLADPQGATFAVIKLAM